MTEEQAKALREPFPASAIGKLPRPTKKDNPKGTCPECGKWHGLPAVHLDYVGHAATTDRLLSVDPEWTWQPMAYTEEGTPQYSDGGLWIWLTVAGVRRPGFGDGDSTKEIIGDAIRNAAMRFGVALDLWAKEDLHDGEPREHRTEGPAPQSPPRSWTKVRELVEGSEVPTAWEVFDAYVRAASYFLFGETESKKLTPDQRKVMLQKAAGAAVWLAENPNTPVGGTWSVEHQRQGWAAVMDGAQLEVPDLGESPPEDEDELERLARLAEETIVGPPE